MVTRLRLLLTLIAAGLCGCPGGLTLPPGGGRDSAADSNNLVWPDSLQINLEGGAPDASVVDLAPAPDLPPIILDQKVTADSTTPGTGGPCPCKAPLLCVLNACRATCNTPTGGCKVTSNCPATHACVPLNGGVAYVCIPGASTGKSCGSGSNQFCAVNNICASYNKNPYVCHPVCAAKGAPCGTGGTCAAYGACLFCTKP